MLQEAIELQLRAVKNLFQQCETGKRELTFRAPTGSGKTHMMADLMNRVLERRNDVVFLVSTLSKGDLAQQNYAVFQRLKEQKVFPNLRPHLISTEISGEEQLYIPTDCNVYLLARDLYKKNGRLMQGAMQNFLLEMTEDYFGKGKRKKIYLIKDECHQATNNLDDISEKFFTRILNFSATPELSRGQLPDVYITNEEAESVKLIKHVEYNFDETITVDVALKKLLEIKRDYNNLLQVNPCLIIQISNKDKATQEWEEKILPALKRHQQLKWMYIVDKDADCQTNDSVCKQLKPERWKAYAREKDSLVDVIIFKMVISEGWDIPRACMLFQVRDSTSKQLNEQVMGRVRRNPRLTDFECLSPEAQELAMKAWIWCKEGKDIQPTVAVDLWSQPGVNLQNRIRVRTTRLDIGKVKKKLDLEKEILHNPHPVRTNIFELHRRLQQVNPELQEECYNYTRDNIQCWFDFVEQLPRIKAKYEDIVCNYDENMKEDEETSFPIKSYYTGEDNQQDLENWVWCREDSHTSFGFDSEAEWKWATFLKDKLKKYCDFIDADDGDEDSRHYLWGKNYASNSTIKYEYYAEGIHKSYPDFILKDQKGIIHVFEVKSVNVASGSYVDKGDYEKKIKVLSDCYLAASRLLDNHVFYLPILDENTWKIHSFCKGIQETITRDQLLDRMK